MRMRSTKMMLAAAALSMVASPVLAANPAAKLSVAPTTARASADHGTSRLAGSGLIVAAFVAAIVLIVVVADNKEDPSSP